MSCERNGVIDDPSPLTDAFARRRDRRVRSFESIFESGINFTRDLEIFDDFEDK